MSAAHIRKSPAPEPVATTTTSSSVPPHRKRRDEDQVPAEAPRAEATDAAKAADAAAQPADAAPGVEPAAESPASGGVLGNTGVQMAGLGLLGLAVAGAAAGGGGGGGTPTPASTAEQQPPAGQKPDAQQPGSQVPDGAKPDGQQQPGGQRPDQQQPGGQTPDPQQPGGQTPDGTKPDGQQPDGQQPDGQQPGGQTPDPQQPGGQTPDGTKPDGERQPGGETPGDQGPGPDVPSPTLPAKPGVALVADTGISASDRGTRDGTLQVDGIQPGNTWKYRIDGDTTWVTGGPDHQVPGTSFSTDGDHRVEVVQVDALGQVSEISELPFHLDRTGPEAQLTVALLGDTRDIRFPASRSDGITWFGTLTVGGLDASSPWSYSIDGGEWVPGVGSLIPHSAFAEDGLHTVQVKQTDVAGNDGAVTSFEFTLDRVVAPTSITFDRVSETADGQLVTNGSKLLVEVAEAGTLVRVRLNSSDDANFTAFNSDPVEPGHPSVFELQALQSGWGGSVLKQGVNVLNLHVVDPAGNNALRSYSFIYDTVAPDAPTLALKHDDGVSATDKRTSDGTLSIAGLEKEGSWKYSLDGGKTWDKGAGSELSGAVFTAAGPQAVQVIQTDLAGNDSQVTVFDFTLTPPTGPLGGTSVI